MSLLKNDFVKLIDDLNKSQSNLKSFFSINEKLYEILFSKHYEHISYDREVVCQNGNKIIRIYSKSREIVCLKKSLSNSDFQVKIFDKINDLEDVSLIKTKVFCIQKVKNILSEKTKTTKTTKKTKENRCISNVEVAFNKLSKDSLLLDEDGFISQFALLKGFMQKEEIILEEEVKITEGIFQPKKIVSVVLIHHQNQYVVYYINDATNIRKCREVDGFEDAKKIYGELSKEMKIGNWVEIYWKNKISYLN